MADPSAAATGFRLLVPGPLDQRTGGYRYDDRVVRASRAAGADVQVHALAGTHPFPDATTRAAAAAMAAALPDDLPVVVDGLALPALVDAFAALAARVPTIALVHHPLCQETGLSPADADVFRRLERDLLPLCRGAIATSPATASALPDFGLVAGSVAVVVPGTDAAPEARRGSGGSGVSLLAVGALIPRKGYATLIEALARLGDLDWSLLCLGATDRAPATTAAVRTAIARQGLDKRVVLAGEGDDRALVRAYRGADVFVLASYHEGYGMAFAEAQAWGLPIVASGTGAVRETVGGSGIVVSPGDPDALAAALRDIVSDGARRKQLAAASRAAGLCLPDWQTQAGRFRAAVARLAGR